MRSDSANPVDKLGSTRSALGARGEAHRATPDRALGARGFNRSSSSMSSASLVPCGKERMGFPQAGGAGLSEIHYPVDPEIWKRRCATKCCLLVRIGQSEAAIRTGGWALRVICLLPGGDYNTGLWIPQGTLRA